MANKRINRKNKAYSDLRFIPCKVEPGMFHGERLVFLDVIDPQNVGQTACVQLLVDQRHVSGILGTPKRNDPAPGWLRVPLLGKEK